MLFPESDVLPAPHSRSPLATVPPPRDPAGTFFHKIHFHLPCASRGAQSGAQDDQKCPEGGKKKSKSSLSGAKSVTFTCEIGESGPLLKHQQGLCFHHIMKVRATPSLLRNSPRERTAHRERFFSHFWLHFWSPRNPKAAQGILKRAQKDSQSLPGDIQNPSEIDVGPHLGIQRGPGGSRGTPGTENDTQIDEKTIKKASIPLCFLTLLAQR